MKLCLITLAVTSLISCNGSSQQTKQQKEIEPNWRVAQITTQHHSYNKSGLLDTTRRAEDVYVNGVSGVVMNFIITRDYDERNNNKLVERTFEVLKASNKLFEELSYKYDSNNNIILVTDKVENIVSEIIQNTYNNNNQKTEEISIHKKFQQHPWDGNIDSALAHLDDKEIPHYDTSIISYKYDKEGNLINKLYRSSGGEIGETVTTLYSGRQKMLSYGITSKGDTATRINYLKSGNLITEIKENPLYSDTSLFDGDKLIQEVSISKTSAFNSKETFKYDDKGNVIEDVKYK